VELEHLAATPVGGSVVVEATLSTVDGRRLGFTVSAKDGETLAAKGTVERMLVDRERFVAKAVNR
jgi:predicted thioesterase